MQVFFLSPGPPRRERVEEALAHHAGQRLSATMEIDPEITDAAKVIPSCPECGGTAYAIITRVEDDTVKAARIDCTGCGLDVLAAYRERKRN